MRYKVVESVMKWRLKEKMRAGIFRMKPSIKRINKLAEWLNTYNQQRMRILK